MVNKKKRGKQQAPKAPPVKEVADEDLIIEDEDETMDFIRSNPGFVSHITKMDSSKLLQKQAKKPKAPMDPRAVKASIELSSKEEENAKLPQTLSDDDDDGADEE